jgi:hypothetical protein
MISHESVDTVFAGDKSSAGHAGESVERCIDAE